MSALVILTAAVLGVVLIVASIRNAADRVTAELRAIAEQEADERRQAGIAEGVRRMDALGKSANR